MAIEIVSSEKTIIPADLSPRRPKDERAYLPKKHKYKAKRRSPKNKKTDARGKYLEMYHQPGFREISMETRRVLRDVDGNITLLRRAARDWVRTQSVESIAFILCVSTKSALAIIDSNIFQSAVRVYQTAALASEDGRIRGMVTKAMDRLEECLDSNRQEIFLKAALATFHLVYVGKHLKMESQALLDSQGKVKWDMIQRDALKASKETRMIEEWMAKQKEPLPDQSPSAPVNIPDKIVELDRKEGLPDPVVVPIDYYDPKRKEEEIMEMSRIPGKDE